MAHIMLDIHGPYTARAECPECGEVKAAAFMHMDKMNVLRALSFQCNECGYTYRTEVV